MAAVVILPLLVNACAVDGNQEDPEPVRATICCPTLAELRYRPLAPDRPGLFDIDANSQGIPLDTGRSPVVAVELPAFVRPYTVAIRSYAVGGAIQRSHVFYPAVQLLDRDHRVLARLEPDDLPVVTCSFADAARENRWGLAVRLEWSIRIEAPDTRYLVIHTTARAVAARSPFTTRQVVPVILPGVVTAVPGGKQQVEIAHSESGRIALQVMQ